MKINIKKLLIFSFAIVLFTSCGNEDIDDLSQVSTADLIAEGSELFDLVTRVTAPIDDENAKPIVCIKFIYNFTVVIYNENTQLEFSQIVSSDQQFSEILGNVTEGQYIGVSFPITSQLPDGTTFEVSNKDELKEAIDACVIEEQQVVIGQCEGILQTCVWEVMLPDTSEFDTYENAVFDVAEDGTVDFYHRGMRYTGTWIVYFILDELHININLDDDFLDDEYVVDADWNFDWKTVIVDAETMNIEIDGGRNYVLKQACDEEDYCTTLTFTECEDVSTPDMAMFVLENYIECIDIIASPEPQEENADGSAPDDIEYILSFFETEEDANDNTNVLDGATAYTNLTNPQIIFVRIEHPVTGEFTVIEITLEAIACP